MFDSISASPLDDRYASGFIPGCGTYFCMSCGAQLALRETDELPECASCGGSRFRRDSIFSARQEHEHETVTAEQLLPASGELPAWLEAARRSLPQAGNHLVFHDGEGIATHTIERGWTRIGRSEHADVCLDDPTVSRRHALIVAEPGKQLRVLDDRSLNGVFVNGVQTELKSLRHGDELTIGRFRLYFLRS
jgi:predicted RNA-binding Zn-ribbon protein involved in translation (DUF1610 family)